LCFFPNSLECSDRSPDGKQCKTPDWRWLVKRDDSPRYPTARLFRQTQDGDWDGVFARIAAAVREKIGKP
jgi:hypothetical protein